MFFFFFSNDSDFHSVFMLHILAACPGMIFDSHGRCRGGRIMSEPGASAGDGPARVSGHCVLAPLEKQT